MLARLKKSGTALPGARGAAAAKDRFAVRDLAARSSQGAVEWFLP